MCDGNYIDTTNWIPQFDMDGIDSDNAYAAAQAYAKAKLGRGLTHIELVVLSIGYLAGRAGERDFQHYLAELGVTR